jgi:ribonuclease D
MEYKLINSNEKLIGLRIYFHDNNITKIAMDFEGDFGLHAYGNKLCLIQIFDKKDFYIIDPFKISKSEMSRFFADKKIIKYMYGSGSDVKLIYEQYKVKLQSVYDLQFLIDVLDMPEKSLDKVIKNILNIDLNYDKKKYQMYNWARRPLPEDTIEYALSDVKYLFDIHELAIKIIDEKNLFDATIEKFIRSDYDFELKDKTPPIFRSKTFRDLPEKGKTLLIEIYNIRESAGKKYDLPTNQIISNDNLFKLVDDVKLVKKLNFNRRITAEIKDDLTKKILRLA